MTAGIRKRFLRYLSFWVKVIVSFALQIDVSSLGTPRVAFKPDCRQLTTSVSLLSEPIHCSPAGQQLARCLPAEQPPCCPPPTPSCLLRRASPWTQSPHTRAIPTTLGARGGRTGTGKWHPSRSVILFPPVTALTRAWGFSKHCVFLTRTPFLGNICPVKGFYCLRPALAPPRKRPIHMNIGNSSWVFIQLFWFKINKWDFFGSPSLNVSVFFNAVLRFKMWLWDLEMYQIKSIYRSVTFKLNVKFIKSWNCD